MRKTLANLEREEKAVIKAYKDGQVCAHSAREHAYNIKRHGLYEAAGYDSWNQYAKDGRLLGLSHGYAKTLAICGEIEGYIPKACTQAFSDRALQSLGTIRVDGSQDLDIPKLKRVINGVLKRADNGETITEKLCREVIADKTTPKKETAADLGEQIEEKYLKQALKLLHSFEDLHEGAPDALYDANEQYPGCVKRLATAYSSIASFLRKVL